MSICFVRNVTVSPHCTDQKIPRCRTTSSQTQIWSHALLILKKAKDENKQKFRHLQHQMCLFSFILILMCTGGKEIYFSFFPQNQNFPGIILSTVVKVTWPVTKQGQIIYCSNEFKMSVCFVWNVTALPNCTIQKVCNGKPCPEKSPTALKTGKSGSKK